MKILIVVASKHGSTREIAEAMGEEMRAAGHEADLFDAGEAPPPHEYDGVIVGSAVYMGRWMAEAQTYVEAHSAALKELPVWLFSSGPLGDEYPEGMGIPENIEELMTLTGAQEHEVFVGKLDKSELGLGERLVTRAVKAPAGDFRDWKAIRRWARLIARNFG